MRVAVTPREEAHSSPTASRFQSRARQKRTKITGRIIAPIPASTRYSTASSPPISQRVMAKDCEKVATLCRNRIVAMEMLLMLTPASSSVNEDTRRRSKAMASTSTSVMAAPANAATHVAGNSEDRGPAEADGQHRAERAIRSKCRA